MPGPRPPAPQGPAKPPHLKPGPEEAHRLPQDLPLKLRDPLPREGHPPLPEGEPPRPSPLPGHLPLEVPKEGEAEPLGAEPSRNPGLAAEDGNPPRPRNLPPGPLYPPEEGKGPVAEPLQDQGHPFRPHLPLTPPPERPTRNPGSPSKAKTASP